MNIESGPNPNKIKPECPYDKLSIYDMGSILMKRLPEGKIDRLDDYFQYKLTKAQMDTININMIKRYKTELGNGPFCGSGPFIGLDRMGSTYLPINSYSNIIQVEFTTDKETQRPGFQLSWIAKPIREISNFDCTFDEGLCPGWSQARSGPTGEDMFDWDIRSGETETEATGPKFDHTMGSLGKCFDIFFCNFSFFKRTFITFLLKQSIFFLI